MTTRLPIAALILTTFAALATSTGGLPSGSRSWAIRDVRLFDGVRVVPKTTVLVRDGRIAAIDPVIPVEEGIEVIDGAGRTLLPGRIDAHTHALGDALTGPCGLG